MHASGHTNRRRDTGLGSGTSPAIAVWVRSNFETEGWSDRAIRGLGAYAKPALSVIFTAAPGDLDWNTSLAPVAEECAWLGAELIVVRPCEIAVDAAAVPDNARIVSAPANASRSQLRRLGMAAASGDIIRMVDALPADTHWASGLLAHLDPGDPGRYETLARLG